MKSSTLILSYLFIWIYWGVGIANTSCEAKQRRIDLIADLAFEQGISVRDPQEGIDKRCGTIYFGKLTNKKPVWILSQWASRYNLYDTILQKGKRGELAASIYRATARKRNTAKQIQGAEVYAIRKIIVL